MTEEPMTEPIELDDLTPERAMSRRNLIVGASAAALGLSAVMSAGSVVDAAPPHPEVLAPSVAGLQYIGLDATDFWPDGNYNGGQDPRVIDILSGVGVAFGGGNNAAQLAASIPLPAGSVIRQISVAYQGTPIINVYAKALVSPVTLGQYISSGLAAGGGNKTQTITLNGSRPQLAPIRLVTNTSYTVRFYVGPGDSIHAVSIGYTPPLQGFVPVTGHQRVLDTRSSGGKLQPGQVRTVAAGVAGARSTMFSLIVLGTEGAGSVACFPANIAYPGNSSIAWFGTGQTLENTVVSAVDSHGNIKIRGGTNRTHVIIDRIGHFY
jgi:hypothetical protein